jgi:hypothetical protein
MARVVLGHGAAARVLLVGFGMQHRCRDKAPAISALNSWFVGGS